MNAVTWRKGAAALRPAVLCAIVLGLGLAAFSATTLSPLSGGRFEASGVTAVPGAEGVLFVDDGRPGEVFWLPLTPQGAQAADVRPVPIGVAMADPEGITTDGTWVYVVGSLSRGAGASLARFRFDAKTKAASGVESMTGLISLLQSAVLELRAGGRGRTRQAEVNIEGLAWDPKGRRLLLGLRAPVVDGDALVISVRLRDATAPLAAGNIVVDAPALRIPLGGSGIRSIEYDAIAGVFQIIAGDPLGARDSRLVTWGGPGGAVRDVLRFASGGKPEGVTRVTLGGRAMTVVMFDTSQFAVLP